MVLRFGRLSCRKFGIVPMFFADIGPSIGLRIIFTIRAVLEIGGNPPLSEGKVIRCPLGSAQFHTIPAHDLGGVEEQQSFLITRLGDIFGFPDECQILVQCNLLLEPILQQN